MEMPVRMEEYFDWLEIIESGTIATERIHSIYSEEYLSSLEESRRRGIEKADRLRNLWVRGNLGREVVVDCFTYRGGEKNLEFRQVVMDREEWHVRPSLLRASISRGIRSEAFHDGEAYSLIESPANVPLKKLIESGAVIWREEGDRVMALVEGQSGEWVPHFRFTFLHDDVPFPSHIEFITRAGNTGQLLELKSPSSDGLVDFPAGVNQQLFLSDVQFETPSIERVFRCEFSSASNNKLLAGEREVNSAVLIDEIEGRRISLARPDDLFPYITRPRDIPTSRIVEASRNTYLRLLVLVAVLIVALARRRRVRGSRARQRLQISILLLAYSAASYVGANQLRIGARDASIAQSEVTSPLSMPRMPDAVASLAGGVSATFAYGGSDCGYWALLALARATRGFEKVEEFSQAGLESGAEDLSLGELVGVIRNDGAWPHIEAGLEVIERAPKGSVGLVLLSPGEGLPLHWVAMRRDSSGELLALNPSLAESVDRAMLGDGAVLSVMPLASRWRVVPLDGLVGLSLAVVFLAIGVRNRQRVDNQRSESNE